MNTVLSKILVALTILVGAILFLPPVQETPALGGAEIAPINIDGVMVPFTYTDENQGEDLLIYADHENYYGLGAVNAHFAIKNTSDKDQQVKIFIPVQSKQKVQEISRYLDNTTTEYPEKVLVPAFTDEHGSTTAAVIEPAYTITKTNWEVATLKPFVAPAKARKVSKDALAEKETGLYLIKAGETAYFRTKISFSEKQEFFIEAYGDQGGYGHLDPTTWPSIENFDSYTNGNSIDGGSGGSGFTGNWTLVGGTITTDTAPTGGQGCIAAHLNEAGDHATRAFTSISDSTVHFQWWNDGTNTVQTEVMFRGGGTTRFGVRMNATGSNKVDVSNGTSYNTNIGTYSDGTWQTIDVKFGHVAGKFAVSINGGAYSSDFDATGGSTAVDTIRFIEPDASGANFYVDDIGATAGATCSVASPDSIADDFIIFE